MSPMVKVIVLLSLISLCNSSALNCPQFFNAPSPWPRTKTGSSSNLTRLCQTRPDGSGVSGPALFATLYDVTNRIPVYTANKVKYTPTGYKYLRPNSDYWKRVASSLCDTALPTTSVASDIEKVNTTTLAKCNTNQAIDADYKNNGMKLDRGHLTPSGINNQDCDKQIGTFTLTNVAPQYGKFNQISWNQYEQLVVDLLKNEIPNEYVYIITGTANNATDKFMNNGSMTKKRVRIPGKFWKAVCYPGNSTTGKPAWGYAIVQDNVDVKKTADKNNYITLSAFAATYFLDPPFSQACMNAPIP